MEADPSAPEAPSDLKGPHDSSPPIAERGHSCPPDQRLQGGQAGTGGQECPRSRIAPKPAASRRFGIRDAAPVETGTTPDTEHPVFQKALEILRREMPPPGQVQSLKSKVQSLKSEVQSLESTEPSLQITVPAPPSELRAPHSELRTQILPARMLNEFVYCPRLFYYEFVESVFVESADTLRGKALHRRVDSGKGELPARGGEGRR